MKTPEQTITELKNDRQELKGKIDSLELFIMNSDFQTLPREEKLKFIQQHEAMMNNSAVLFSRIKRMQAQLHLASQTQKLV